jgi:hypothetical protein
MYNVGLELLHSSIAHVICEWANSSQEARRISTSQPQRGQDGKWLMPGKRSLLTWPGVF